MITGLNLSSLSSAMRVASTSLASTTVRTTTRAATPVEAPSSTKVMFGSQTSDIAAVYSLSPKKISATSPQDAMMKGLLQAAVGSNSLSPLGSIGSTLLSNLKESRTDVTHAVTSATAGAAGQQSAVSLDIVTQSGSTLHLNMTQKEDGVVVELKTDGEALNDDEAAAVANLGASLEKALSGLGQNPPKIDISGLTNFDSSVLKSVDLKTDIRADDASVQSLNFHASTTERYVAYQDKDFSLKVSSDLSNPALAGDYAQQQATLSAYDTKFDKARSTGHGDRDQMEALKSVFRALNTTASAQRTAITVGADIRVDNSGRSQLSGLNDFSLSLTQTEKSINPARDDEKDRFSYQASQSTTENVLSDGSKSVKQTSRSHISAAWHEALDPSIPLALNKMKSSQNYTYHLLENDEESTTTLNYNSRGMLASVGHNEQVNNRETVKKYVRGELVDQTVTPVQYARSNVLSLLKSA